jgi:uncharacterized protein YqgC (DUF456 family)
MLLDVLAGFLGVYDVTNLTRAVTGAIFGAVLPFFIIPIATEAFSQLLISPQREANTHLQRDLPNV